MIATMLIPVFFFFLARRRGTGLSTRVVTVVLVLCDVSTMCVPLVMPTQHETAASW